MIRDKKTLYCQYYIIFFIKIRIKVLDHTVYLFLAKCSLESDSFSGHGQICLAAVTSHNYLKVEKSLHCTQ